MNGTKPAQTRCSEAGWWCVSRSSDGCVGQSCLYRIVNGGKKSSMGRCRPTEGRQQRASLLRLVRDGETGMEVGKHAQPGKEGTAAVPTLVRDTERRTAKQGGLVRGYVAGARSYRRNGRHSRGVSAWRLPASEKRGPYFRYGGISKPIASILEVEALPTTAILEAIRGNFPSLSTAITEVLSRTAIYTGASRIRLGMGGNGGKGLGGAFGGGV